MQSAECGYIDLQVNGYVGIDFNDPQLTVEQVQAAALAMSSDGVTAALPTVITASPDSMQLCIGTLANAIDSLDEVRQVFRGIHVEGPFLSPRTGFIGAHPSEHASKSDPGLLDALIEAGKEHIRLVTLAPEIDRGGQLTRRCVERGIHVAAGHSDAPLDDLACCIEAGLGLFTHLGNGCPKLMDRHDNIIYRALHFTERICYSVIADGFHIPSTLFFNLLRWIPRDRLVVVSDAISAAGLGPGTYQLGSRTVTIGADRAARDPSGEHFVGSASRMCDADLWLAETMSLGQVERDQLLKTNPAQFIV